MGVALTLTGEAVLLRLGETPPITAASAAQTVARAVARVVADQRPIVVASAMRAANPMLRDEVRQVAETIRVEMGGHAYPLPAPFRRQLERRVDGRLKTDLERDLTAGTVLDEVFDPALRRELLRSLNGLWLNVRIGPFTVPVRLRIR